MCHEDIRPHTPRPPAESSSRPKRAELLRAVHKAEETQQQIADRFGMSQSYVSRVAQDAHAIFDLLDRWHLSEAELADELSWED